MRNLICVVFLLTFFANTTSAQTTATTKGRILGQNMEELEGVTIINMCNAETVTSNKRGFFQIKATKGDTLVFTFAKYSGCKRAIKHPADHVNVILINKKTAALSHDFTAGEYERASHEDEKLYKILDKGAEQSGLWNY
ncbi:MAG: hypothetical protein ACXVB0_01380 [Mucilaginibacter sp.]